MFVRFNRVLMNAASGAEGGGGAPAPAATEAPAAPAQPVTEPTPSAGKKTAAELKAELKSGKFKAFLEQKKAEKAAERGAAPAPAQAADEGKAAAPSEAAQKAAEALEEAGEKVPEQKEGESDKKYELRLATMLQRTRELEALNKREGARAEAAEKKAAEIEKRIADAERQMSRLKSEEEVLLFLHDNGWDYERLTKAIVEGKAKVPGKTAQVDPETRKLLEEQQATLQRLEKERAEERARELQRQEQVVFEQNTQQAADWLKENADDYPLLAASSWAATTIVQAAYRTKNFDIATHARAIEESLAKDALALVGDERSIKALSKRDGTLKEKLQKALGLTPAQAKAAVQAIQQAAPAPTRATVANVPSEATTPPKGLSRAELKAQARAGIAELKRQRGAR